MRTMRQENTGASVRVPQICTGSVSDDFEAVCPRGPMSQKGDTLPLGRVVIGDTVAKMAAMPPASVDLVFADPPYNLQLGNELKRPDDSQVNGVDAEWDRFSSFEAYDAFTRAWLIALRRLLKPQATVFVIGSYHNIFRVGTMLQDLGFWILGDIVWRKSNPMPNFRGRRFTNAHETMIWAAKDEKARSYTFNYASLKAGNEDVQMRSDWQFPICTGSERLKSDDGSKLHPTQKPEALLSRVILSASRPGDIVFDPFLGTGTTGAVARRLGRRWCGIERDATYAKAAQARIDAVDVLPQQLVSLPPGPRQLPRVSFQQVVERGLVEPGATLVDVRGQFEATVRPDGALICNGTDGTVHVGSIHQVGARIQKRESCNGWSFWHLKSGKGRVSVDDLRARIRKEWAGSSTK